MPTGTVMRSGRQVPTCQARRSAAGALQNAADRRPAQWDKVSAAGPSAAFLRRSAPSSSPLGEANTIIGRPGPPGQDMVLARQVRAAQQQGNANLGRAGLPAVDWGKLITLLVPFHDPAEFFSIER
jgi:hypothetical protein